MTVQEGVSLTAKTTMRIGGTDRYFADLLTQQDIAEAVAFAAEKNIPLIPLGNGSNTVFANTEINALVVRIKADTVTTDGNTVTVQAGKNLAMLINELAAKGLDLSALTGIPGTVGGALFGNAGQGPKGVWIDSFVESVTAYMDGSWKTLTKEECHFRYRESIFKDSTSTLPPSPYSLPPILWQTTLTLPSSPPKTIQETVQSLLQRRIETQPHLKTAGSCFKGLPDGTPAWQLIEAAGLRGLRMGDVQVSEKHANFLLNLGNGTFDDVVKITQAIRENIPELPAIEMRLYGEDGTITT